MQPVTDKQDRAAAHEQANLAAGRFDLSTIVPVAGDFRQRLGSIEGQITALPFEVAFLFTADGRECARFKGKAQEVEINLDDEQEQQMAGGILTHNHPDGSFFSLKDLRLMVKLKLAELRAVRAGTPARALVLVTHPNAYQWATLADFDAYWDSEQTLHYQHEYEQNRMNGMPLKSEVALLDKANETWPAYFEQRLPQLGYVSREWPLPTPG
jgi:hypothetical protein